MNHICAQRKVKFITPGNRLEKEHVCMRYKTCRKYASCPPACSTHIAAQVRDSNLKADEKISCSNET